LLVPLRRGVQGSHFANVMRRVLRLCAACNNNRTEFICTTATISNPREHVKVGLHKRVVCVCVCVWNSKAFCYSAQRQLNTL
jgi:DEAD/DEAH box helicase domain-containing protein